MDTATNTRDLEYGYPSLERGISFPAQTHCSFLEILRYETLDGKEDAMCEEGELSSGEEVKGWILRDPEREISTLTKRVEDNNGDVVQKKKFVGGLRLLYGSCTYDTQHNYRLLPFQREDFDVIEERLKLPEQFLSALSLRTSSAFKFSCPPSNSCVEDKNESVVEFRPEACQVFKFSIFRPSYYHLGVSHSRTTNLTYAILISKTTDHAFPTIIQSLTLKPTISLQPMYLPTIISDLCTSSSARRIQEVDTKLNELEETMGQHEWTNRPMGDPMEMDFLKVGRRLNFIARMCGVERMRIGGLLMTLEEVRGRNGKGERGERGERLIEELVGFYENSCRNLALRVEYEERRVQSQLAVVYQFMAQKDAKVNIELAATSTMIAKETKKDGSSMKTIAILTMFFLPGTFLAALFAMPLFNWDDDELPILKSRFKYYWAIAIPLTIFVLLVWALAMFFPWRDWIIRRRAHSKRRDLEATGFKEQ